MQPIVLAGLLGALLNTGGPTAPDVFTRCDGYPVPPKFDGIATGVLLGGLAAIHEDRRPVEIEVGAGAVEVCDQALADPRLKPEFVYRRSSLMMAKAAHLMAAGKPADALAVLEADRASFGPAPDGLRERGQGIASRLLRAKALIDLGRPAEALPLIAEVERFRPFAATNRGLATSLRNQAEPGLETYLADARRNAPLTPSRLVPAMIMALGAGQMSEAVALGRGLTLATPKLRGPWKVEGDGPSDYSDIASRANVAGMLAYALEATGSGAAADAVLDGAIAVNTRAIAPPPGSGKSWKRSVQDDYNRRLAEGGKGERSLNGWRKAITLRRAAATMTSEQLLGELSRDKPDEVSLVVADIVGQIGVLRPGEAVQRQAFVDQQHRDFLAEIIGLPAASIGELFRALPRPETGDNQPRLNRAGDGFFLSDNGYSSAPMDLPDRWTVRFTSARATAASVDEQAFISAAALTRAKGFGHFIVETRWQIQRTAHQITTYAETDVSEGRETLMTIRLVRPDQLPADLHGAEWRIIDAAKVLAAFNIAAPQAAR